MGRLFGVLIALALALALPASAQAAFPGGNGKIAFVRSADIWTMNPDGTNPVNLTNDAAPQGNPKWSADGNRIVFDEFNGSNTKTWHMLADGSDRVLADDGSPFIVTRFSPTWSPNGSRIAFSSGPQLLTMNPDGSVIFGPLGRVPSDPDWSPAGDLIAFQQGTGRNDDGQPCAFENNLAVAAQDGSSNVKLTDFCGTDINVIGVSWSPDAQRIAYFVDDPFVAGNPEEGFFTIKPDGTDRQKPAAGGPEPAWSPDGTKIAFVTNPYADSDIKVMNPDGTGVSPTIAVGSDPDWQPLPAGPGSADVLTTITDSPDPVKGGAELHYTATAANFVGPNDASGVTLTVNLPAGVFFVSATPTQGSCSHAAGVVTCNLGNLPEGSSADVDILTEARNVVAPTTINATASVTAAETDPVPGNNADSTSTQVVFGAYARPKSASPMVLSLVPSYKPCGAGEDTLQHAPPLSHVSCANPQQTSGHLTVGTPDANSQPANFVGTLKYKALGELPINPGNGDQSDIGLEVSITGVRNKSDLTLYTGGVLVDSTLQITDHDSGAGGFSSNTGPAPNMAFTVPCSGGSCSLNSTYEAVVPGAVKELQRAVWQLGAVRVIDGGADGNPATSPNTVFATQGLFVP